MDRLIKQSWWKILSVLILLYVFIVGMLVPLKPNVTTVTPSFAKSGERVELQVTGYNTSFTESPNELRAWLKLDSLYGIQMTDVVVKNDQQATLIFDLPTGLPTSDKISSLALIIDSPSGSFVRPSALSVEQATIDPDASIAAWSNAPITGIHFYEGMTYPFRNILAETIRNTYFHVSLWLAMMLIFIAAVFYAIKYLRLQSKGGSLESETLETINIAVSARERADFWSQSLTIAGLVFGVLGLVTGALWAKYTWGSWWSWDIKQFTTLIALLIYAGYFVLRAAFPDPEGRARISAVYNIFAFAALIPLIYILPRLSESSLHPGNGGNPAIGSDDLDNTMRMVFYPAIIGWTLFGGWLASLFYRSRVVEQQIIHAEDLK